MILQQGVLRPFYFMEKQKKEKTGEQETKRGRPSEIENVDLKEVGRLAGLGFNEVEIANIIEISPRTLANYKQNPDFLHALKSGKDKADERVVASMYQRAVGYDHEDTYFSSYEGVVTATPYTKHYPPDVAAQIFWLKNRRRQDWREKQDVEISGTIESRTRDLTQEERQKRLEALKSKLQ